MSSSLDPHTQDPYAQLASLFLTEGGDAPPASIPIGSGRSAVRFDDELLDERPSTHPAGTPRPAVAPPIEIALVGHLPVMGGLWLTQYADQVARREGPTALVRLERGQVSFELLRAPGHRGTLEKTISVDEALALLSETASRWIVCPHNEATLDGPLSGDALSLLTGGDDAATVAAYRIMKNLAERWHIAGWPIPPIGLVVLGATPDRVEEVAEKLDRTTKAFLDVDLAIVGQHQRMDAIDSASRRIFQGVELSVSDLCRRVRSQGSRGQRGPERRSAVLPGVAKLAPKTVGREVSPSPFAFIEPEPPTVAAPFEPTAAPERPIFRREPVDLGPPAFDATLHGAATTAGPVATLRSAERDEPLSRIEPAATAPRSANLVQDLPGLTLLPIRCPHHPDVELAVDQRGALHLVVLDTRLASLRPVEAWARAHADLLRAACPDIGGATGVGEVAPIADVVTFDAPSIVPLHGTGLRLHLLVETSTGLVHVGLNRS